MLDLAAIYQRAADQQLAQPPPEQIFRSIKWPHVRFGGFTPQIANMLATRP